MDDDRVLAQAMAAMRCLGIKPNYPQSERELEEAFDRIKRTAIEDWKQGKEFSKRRSEGNLTKTRIIGALLDAVVMEYFKHEDLKMMEMRAADLIPGMFVRGMFDRDATVVVVEAAESGTEFDRSMRLTVIPHDACSSGNLGTSGWVQGGRIVSAAVGVSQIILAQFEPPKVQDS